MSLGVLSKVYKVNRKKYGKAFFETSSNMSNFQCSFWYPDKDTKVTAVDVLTGDVVDEVVVGAGGGSFTLDLSGSDNNKIIYLDVDNNGNNVTLFWAWYYDHNLVWIDLDIIPKIQTLWLGYTRNNYVKIYSKIKKNLKTVYIYNMSLDNIDFLNNTYSGLVKLWGYGNIDVKNATTLNISKHKDTITHIRFASREVPFDTFDFRQFKKTQYLYITGNGYSNSTDNSVDVWLPEINTDYYFYSYYANVNIKNTKANISGLKSFYNIDNKKGNTNYYELFTNTSLQKLQTIYVRDYNYIGNLEIPIPTLNSLTWYSGNIPSIIVEKVTNLNIYGTQTTNLTINDQSGLKYVNLMYLALNIDLRNAINLERFAHIYRQGKVKIDLRNGQNDKLTYFRLSKYYYDGCVLVDDANLPIFTNADKRNGDVITNDETVCNNF